VSEQALSLYSDLIMVIRNVNPEVEMFGGLLDSASAFEEILLNMATSAEEAQKALDKFAMDTDYFTLVENAKGSISFREERLEIQNKRA
jgi:hypothetical protein